MRNIMLSLTLLISACASSPDDARLTFRSAQAPAYAYEYLPIHTHPDDVLPLQPKTLSDGTPLMRVLVREGSWRSNMASALTAMGWQPPLWEGMPPCVDWTIPGNLIIQAVTMRELVGYVSAGFPVEVHMDPGSRIATVRVVKDYVAACTQPNWSQG